MTMMLSLSPRHHTHFRGRGQLLVSFFLMVTASAALASDLLDNAAARAHCEQEWEDNFAMQEFCLNQVQRGFEEFKQLWAVENEETMLHAFEACRKDWGIQWNMTAFCAQQQLRGRSEIPQIVSDLPADVNKRIVDRCFGDWPSNYAMTAFCVRQNAEAWKRINQ